MNKTELECTGELSNITMPSHYYFDPDIFAHERQKIFFRTWQFVGHVNDTVEPGDYFEANIAGESVIVARGDDHQLRAFYNVCQHRAHQVVSGSGNCRLFRCPYHAWSYGLDGLLKAAPGTEDVEGFDKSQIKLRPVRLEEMCGLVFVNLDDETKSLRETYPGLEDEIAQAKPTLASMVRVHEDRIAHHSNWKVSVENFSECYHCPVVHKYVVSNYYSSDEYRISISNGIVRHASKRLNDRDVHGDLQIWFLWPNLAIELFPLHRSISVRLFEVNGLRDTTYVYLWYADPDLSSKARDEIIETGRIYHDTNGAEDARLVASVQKGLESRGYDRGRLIITPNITPQSEHAVAHFQATYADTMDLPN